MAVSKAPQEALKSNGSQASTAEIEERIEELRGEVAALTKALADFGVAKADDYRAGLDRLAADVKQASAQAFQSAKDEAVSLEQSLETQIRSRPLHAVGIAVGIGFLAALLTRRG
ncbi:DUF883 family protein [Rhizobium sp. KVB221]|uniref:DUF883 family protein n=1 Tax=Rhizobium setariae TaxID=2801340 RepID=A0A936YM09_9HYPH|nr:DUF883 family protein [Rhizobium setariae]MBL0370646.1 DUF883 family protein [Rhizobium setariae]